MDNTSISKHISLAIIADCEFYSRHFHLIYAKNCNDWPNGPADKGILILYRTPNISGEKNSSWIQQLEKKPEILAQKWNKRNADEIKNADVRETHALNS